MENKRQVVLLFIFSLFCLTEKQRTNVKKGGRNCVELWLMGVMALRTGREKQARIRGKRSSSIYSDSTDTGKNRSIIRVGE